MRVKKTGGRVFGTTMTAAEKQGMKLEIKRQLAEYDRKHLVEMDAMVLWVLHDQFGFGPKRLRRYYDAFSSSIDALVDRYQMDTDDEIWLCTQKLKEIGVDLEEWREEQR